MRISNRAPASGTLNSRAARHSSSPMTVGCATLRARVAADRNTAGLPAADNRSDGVRADAGRVDKQHRECLAAGRRVDGEFERGSHPAVRIGIHDGVRTSDVGAVADDRDDRVAASAA